MGPRARKLKCRMQGSECRIRLAVLSALCILHSALAAQGPLPTPTFHHLHLNSVNPEAAIDFYVKAFSSTSKTTFAGQPALASPNNVLVLFNRVATPPATRSEEHTSELQSQSNLVCRLLL